MLSFSDSLGYKGIAEKKHNPLSRVMYYYYFFMF